MLFLFFMRRKHSPPSGLRVLLWPLRSVFRSARIFTQNRAFQKWKRENPSKHFSDYFAEIVRPGLQRGQAHPTLGRNLPGSAFGEAAKKTLKMLIANGLNEDDVCVDYGCGTLRVGVHVIKYLQRGAYWGLDVDEAVLEEGRKLVGNSLLTGKAPHLHVISPRSIAEAAAAKPKISILGKCIGACGPGGSKEVFRKHFDNHRRFRRCHNPWPMELLRDGSVLRAKLGTLRDHDAGDRLEHRR